MQQKKENVTKQSNKKEKKQESLPISKQQKYIQISSIIQIKNNKKKYLALFFMLLQVIITTVLLVLLITLGYVGFVGWNVDQGTSKIHVESLQRCSDEYMRRQSEFIVIKIKAAFIILCAQFPVILICMIDVFQLLMKVIMHQKLHQLHNQSNIKSLFMVINILLSISITQNVFLFGTYLGFCVMGNNNKLSQQCRLSIVDSEVIAITILFGVKLGLLLIVWGLMICQTIENNSQNGQQNPLKQQKINIKVSNPKFPQIRQFHSVEEYHIPQRNKMNILMNSCPNSYQEYNLRPLKTEDFLLELKNNQNTQKQLKLFIINDKFKQVEKQQYQDNYTNRRLMIFQPKVNSQCMEIQNDLRKSSMTQRKYNQIEQDQCINQLSSQQKEMNGILSLNSINKGPNNNDLERALDSLIQVKKNIISCNSINTKRNKFIGSDRQSIDEVKSIIDKMNEGFKNQQ